MLDLICHRLSRLHRLEEQIVGQDPVGGIGAAGRDYVQDKVREGETRYWSRSRSGPPGTGRESALGYKRYIAMEHMAEIVPYNPLHFLRPWRSDVRCDWFRFAQILENRDRLRRSLPQIPPTNPSHKYLTAQIPHSPGVSALGGRAVS